MNLAVRVSTPSRIHFGLLRFAQADGPSYGGMGMMIDGPRCELELAPASQWSAAGPQAARALEFARAALEAIDAAAHGGKPAALAVQVHAAIPAHQGLGGGTQLALATAAAIFELLELPRPTPTQLVAATGRGRRSAVGTHGFAGGGLIWERGRLPHEQVGSLAVRLPMPDEWRIVLASPRGSAGLSGPSEREAFDALPPVPPATAERLMELAERDILPAAEAGDAARFGEAVHEFGRLSGECFGPVQGGPYATPAAAECVAAIRAWGVPGVGQSSWGPTLFAIASDGEQAAGLCRHLRSRAATRAWDIETSAPDNRGAVLARATAGNGARRRAGDVTHRG